MRLYVIGPVSGIKDDNRPQFERAKRMLESVGYTVTIPHEIVPAGTPWKYAMWTSISYMLTKANAVAVLPGRLSQGSSIELGICMDVNKPVNTVQEWLVRATKAKQRAQHEEDHALMEAAS